MTKKAVSRGSLFFEARAAQPPSQLSPPRRSRSACVLVLGKFEMDAFAKRGATDVCDADPPCAVEVGLTLVLASSTSILIGPSTPLPPAHGSLTQPGAVAAACSCGVSGEAAVTGVAASPLWVALLEPAEDDETGERGSTAASTRRSRCRCRGGGARARCRPDAAAGDSGRAGWGWLRHGADPNKCWSCGLMVGLHEAPSAFF